MGEGMVVMPARFYIQEKIVPRVIHSRTATRQFRGQLACSRDFDGQYGYQEWRFNTSRGELVQPDGPRATRQGDGSLAEKENLRGKIQMIYIDPPYGISFGPMVRSRRKRDVKDGKSRGRHPRGRADQALPRPLESASTLTSASCATVSLSPDDRLTGPGSVFVRAVTRTSTSRSLLDEVFGADALRPDCLVKNTGIAHRRDWLTVRFIVLVLNCTIAQRSKIPQLYTPKGRDEASNLYPGSNWPPMEQTSRM